jgi:energy-coupling factor transport system permease protein
MHPALRILALILFIPCVAHGGWLAALAGALGVIVLLSRIGRPAWGRFVVMNRRLRWFYLSILLLFGWFTPGQALWSAAGFLSPTYEGLLLGMGRASILAVVVGAVVWLLERSSREDLVSGLLWLTAPLQCLGFPRERFAVRLALVLETVPQVQPLVAEARQSREGADRQQWAARARGLFEQVLERAESAPCEPLEIREGSPPGVRHWLVLGVWMLPLLILALWAP